MSAPATVNATRRAELGVGRYAAVLALLDRHRANALMTAIVLFAGALRLIGINWGLNLYLHPDERFMTMVADAISWPGSIGQYFNSDTSPLNPYNRDFGSYVYGTFPLFLTKAIGDLTGNEVYGNLHLVGRVLATLCDLLTVVFVFLVGRRLFSTSVGLLAALLMSLTVLHIQAAHFFTVDAFATTGCIAAFHFALLASARGRWWAYLLAGVAAGLAVASKVSALPILIVLALPALECWRRHGLRAALLGQRGANGRRLPTGLGVGLALVGALWTFKTGQPYAFEPGLFTFNLDARWLADLRYWRDAQAGLIDLPPSHQWADRTPLLFSLRHLVLWGMGLPLGLTALIALLIGAYRLARSRRCPSIAHLFLIGWPAFHLLYYGTSFVKAMRYLLPAYPFLVVLAAGLLLSFGERRLGGRAGAMVRRRPRLVAVPAVIVVVLTALYAFAFTTIYTQPVTRVEASRWIYENLPVGAVIATEHWDDGLPVPLAGHDHALYQGVQLELYNADAPDKLEMLLARLDQADYLVLSSNRLYESIPRLPERYPMTTAYYEMLFAGELGFTEVRSFTSYPRLFGIELVDDGAEESFSVYDHPKVLIFKKTGGYSRHAIETRLQLALSAGPVPILPAQANNGLLLLDDDARAEQQASGTWRRMFDADGLANSVPVLVWYLAIQLMSLAAIPLCWRMCGALPDRGYALAKTLGLLLVSYVAWLLPSLHLVPFGPDAVGLGVLATAGLSVAMTWSRRLALWADLRRRWRWIIAGEALFLIAFLGFVWLRAQNPDLWHPERGGEKPMEVAYLNAVVRTVWFPPYDPWFAGGVMNYYYFGYVVIAGLIRLTGILPAVAFNLAVPTIFALTTLNVWALTASILTASRWHPRWRSPWAPITAALAGPLLTLILGNLDLVMRAGRGEWGMPAQGLRRLLADAGGPATLLAGLWSVVTGRVSLPDDGYWPSSRVIEGTITEFPAFTFLFADLHPHLMALPFTVAALLVALTWFQRDSLPHDAMPSRSTRWQHFRSSDPEAIALIGVSGLLAGTLLATNSWDYPAYLLVMLGGFAGAEFRRTGWTLTFPVARRLVIGGVAIVGFSRLLFWPWLRRYEGLAVDLVPAGGRTRVDEYLVIYGVLLFFVATYLVAELFRGRTRLARLVVVWPVGLAWRADQVEHGQRNIHGHLTLGERAVDLGFKPVAAILGSGALLALLTGSLRWLLVGLFVLAVSVAWRRRDDAAAVFIAALVALAMGISLAVDIVAVGGDAGRMNTVFKFYLQVWMLLGVAAGAGAVIAFGRIGERWHDRLRFWRVWSGIGVVLVAGALVYPALAVPVRLGDRFNDLPPTLDGMAFMKAAVRTEGPEGRPAAQFSLEGDRAGIDWMLQNVQGSPVVLEAAIPDYRWGSRVSIYTGLPTVLGWDYHQQQQRGGYPTMLDVRRQDVQRMLGEAGSFEAIQPLLDTYHVQYIYIGDLERAYYDDDALAKYEDAAARGMVEVVYRADGVTIYRYDGAVV
ncbi:MAG: glycosyltransferase family 39 protein [Chloroflexia bacterium]|nr:glycosyltransferase family 39 protein [Chloroflexia bacterium]